MIVTLSAKRLIENGRIQREDDRRVEIVQVTHHLIAVSKDLKQRVGYAKELLTKGDKPAFVLVEIAKSIEARYESLYEKDLYKYLPGNCVDIITRISGSIYGIVTLATGINVLTSNTPMVQLKDILNNGNTNQSSNENEKINKLEDEIQDLIDKLFALRVSLENVDSGSAPLTIKSCRQNS